MGWAHALLLEGVDSLLSIRDQARQLRDQQSEDLTESMTKEVLATQVRKLTLDNAELRLYMAAVVRLLIHKNVLSRDEVKEVIDMIDASDGQADGNYDGQILK